MTDIMRILAILTLLLLAMSPGVGCKSDRPDGKSGDASVYALRVNGGSGDGHYAIGAVVDITADVAASGQFFDAWTGSADCVADVNAEMTTITMPDADTEITATYGKVASGLVSRYTFDTDARDTYGTNHGTLHASVTDDDVRGKVLSLDGERNYVYLPPDSITVGRGEVTLSLWINPYEWVPDTTIYEEHTNTYWQFTVTRTGWYTRDSSTGISGSRDNDLAMPDVPLGEWHHLAFVYSSSSGRKALYYDGIAHSATSVSIDELTNRRTHAQVGKPGDGHYYHGLVDDLRLYDRALSVAEIALLAEMPTYALTVNSGTGDGDYGQGQVIDIVANTSISGRQFAAWVADAVDITDIHRPATTITMPGSNVEVTATYTDAAYQTLSVNNGSGGGRYQQDWAIDIDADAAPSGQVFDKWIGNTSGIANVGQAHTTLTMAASSVAVTAVYADIAPPVLSAAMLLPEVSRVLNEYSQEDETREYRQRLSLIDEVAARITGQIEQAMSLAFCQMLGTMSPELGRTEPAAGRSRNASPLEIYMEFERRVLAPWAQSNVLEKDLALLREHYYLYGRNAMDSVVRLCRTAAATDEKTQQKIMELCLTLSFLCVPDVQWSFREIDLLPGWMKGLRWLKRAERYAIDLRRPLTTAAFAQYGKKPVWSDYQTGYYLTKLTEQFRADKDLSRERVCLKSIVDVRTRAGADTLPAGLSLASTHHKAGNPRLAAMTVKSAMKENPTSSSWHRAAVARLKYLYASKQYDSLIQEGTGYRKDPRCRAVRPQVIYILWATCLGQNDTNSADELRKTLLEEFPDSPLCADMYLAWAMGVLSQGDHEEASRLLEIVELRYSRSEASSKARKILEKLDNRVTK